ncbi:MAG TPA: sodium:proton antiporter [Polyangiaceae bacterium]|jgi:Na+/H+ antiporter NhaD/arsenite permease-like protein|nr:sodium:proton antiporter [Polyangiaceae bacterium]
MIESFPTWTVVPFVTLVLGIAALPMLIPHLWGKLWFQAAVSAACAAPVIGFLVTESHVEHLTSSVASYASFIATIGALYIVTSGIFVSGDIEATPRTNLVMVIGGAMLASVIGTTGASVLMLRPLLRTNRQRVSRAHLVPFFILLVSNVGGLLTPLGDPPLLLGYLEGVPFLWTLRLFPYWALYIVVIGSIFFVVERRAYAEEPAAAKRADRAEVVPLALHGTFNVALLAGIVVAVLVPSPWREAGMIAIAVASYVLTKKDIHEKNGFSLMPIIEVAVIFAGIFVCLSPIEVLLVERAPSLPLHHPWQLFWCSGALSSVLDNAPTYAAFGALARGLSRGAPGLVAGILPVHLAAISIGSVIMGATTYIGNGPNLVVKAIAERAGYATPSFARYAAIAIAVLVPIHLVTTAVLVWLE